MCRSVCVSAYVWIFDCNFVSDDDDFDPDKGFVKKDENEEWKDEDKEIEKVSGCGVNT